jgi:predicted nucleotide-binding protein
VELSEVRLDVLRHFYEQEMKGSYEGLNVAEFAQKQRIPQRNVEVAARHLVDLGLLKGEYVAGTDVPVIMGITAAGRAAFEEHQAQAERAPSSRGRSDTTSRALQPSAIEPDPKKVYVVYGRDNKLREDFFSFLRALHLEPIEFSARLTGKASPYIGQILDAAFKSAKAVVVLFSPDDEARLKAKFQKPNDPRHEKKLTSQPRQNVLFEAGLAFGTFGDERTILVKVGELRPFSDVLGRYEARLTNDAKTRQDLAHRLKDAGCDIDINQAESDWLTVGNFGAPVKETFVPRRFPKVYVIDWSKPAGSLTHDRVIVVEESSSQKKAFYMGKHKEQDFDSWARMRKIPIRPARGDYQEFKSGKSGITCMRRQPPSIEWLDRVLKRASPRSD